MKNLYLEAPTYDKPGEIKDWKQTVFLGGSITGATDWQALATDRLLPHFHVFNPRRANYSTLDPATEHAQITWEYYYITAATINLFYFSHETLAPITLFEFGALLEQSKLVHYKKLYVAIHPDYKRKNDVIIQCQLRAPSFARNITFDLRETLTNIIIENTK